MSRGWNCVLTSVNHSGVVKAGKCIPLCSVYLGNGIVTAMLNYLEY